MVLSLSSSFFLPLTLPLPLKHTSLSELCCSLLAAAAILVHSACTGCLHRAQVAESQRRKRKLLDHSSPLPPPPSPLLAAIGGPLLLLLVSLPPSLPGRARLLPLPSRLLSPTPPPPPTNPPSHHAAIKDCSFLIPRIAFFILTSRASSSEYSTFCNMGCM